MNKMGWLLIGLGALLLLSHGGLGFFFPLLLLLLLFNCFGGPRRMVGQYRYGWGNCGDAHQRWHDSPERGSEARPVANPEDPSYTGKTIQL